MSRACRRLVRQFVIKNVFQLGVLCLLPASPRDLGNPHKFVLRIFFPFDFIFLPPFLSPFLPHIPLPVSALGKSHSLNSAICSPLSPSCSLQFIKCNRNSLEKGNYFLKLFTFRKTFYVHLLNLEREKIYALV